MKDTDPLPIQFAVSVGGHFGPSYAVRLIEGRLCYQRLDYGDCADETAHITPTSDAWERFWRRVEFLRIWEWQDVYECHDVLDGTGWEVEIEHRGRSVNSTGSNAYPPDGSGPDTTREWRQFCQAVRWLIGNRPFS